MPSNPEMTGDAAMALIKSEAVRLPTWNECHTKKSLGFELTALEYFIEQNEPVGYAGDYWRVDLVKALAECRK